MKKEEQQAVADYRRYLSDQLFEEETKFDAAVLLVAGGAFTVSAVYVPKLEVALKSPFALVTAWTAWSLCILVCVGGHQVSAWGRKRQINLIDAKQYDEVWKPHFWGRAIGPLNWATYILLVIGFVAFGTFTFSNLNFGDSNGKGEEARKEARSQEVQGRATAEKAGREQRSEPAAGLPPPQEKVIQHGKEVAAPSLSTGKPSAGQKPVQQEGQHSQQSAPAGQSDQRSKSATGVSKDTGQGK